MVKRPDNKPDLSLVLACYNEEGHLKKSISEIISVLDISKYSYEIIMVDDRSRDNTRQLIKQIINENKNHRLVAIFHKENTGRGGAVTTGIRAARADIVGYIDADLEVSPLYVPYCVKKVEEGADIVIGSRVYKVRLNGAFRYLTHWIYLKMVRLLIGVRFLQDTESGYKFFRKERILPVLEKCRNTHWFWSTEFVAHSFLQGLDFYQVPCIYFRKRDKKTTVKVVRDSLRYLEELLRFYLIHRKALQRKVKELRQH